MTAAGVPGPVASVSVVLPTLNEQGFIRDCLDSLLAQDYPHIAEILVVDGGSTDATVEIAEQAGGTVRVVPNPRTSAAAAMNIGIAEARGDVIVRADAHALYLPDYVRRCVEVLGDTGAANVGGPMRAVGTSSFGRAVAAVTSSPFGVGPGRFHYSDVREEVDTVYLGSWRRQTLVDIGGYDETSLQWGAEDHELNHRITQAGGVIVLDPSIRSWYFPRETPRALARQYFNYGVGKVSTFTKHGTLPTWRPLAPAALVLAAAVALASPRPLGRVAVPAAHAAAASVVAMQLSRDQGVAPHRALSALAICHWSYGAGIWAGLLRRWSGRGFDRLPRAGRR
ncbi:MAG TPA: glycosyltransferase family 2 protein [Acidimicrobiales bacterium]|nr:glycosyltransferase family 2 protein [Acidimicrobiales bacterium]